MQFQEAKQLFDHLDKDKSGSIDFEEFLNLLRVRFILHFISQLLVQILEKDYNSIIQTCTDRHALNRNRTCLVPVVSLVFLPVRRGWCEEWFLFSCLLPVSLRSPQPSRVRSPKNKRGDWERARRETAPQMTSTERHYTHSQQNLKILTLLNVIHPTPTLVSFYKSRISLKIWSFFHNYLAHGYFIIKSEFVFIVRRLCQLNA